MDAALALVVEAAVVLALVRSTGDVVGAKVAVLFCAWVEVTDATTWETVMVLVNVAVDVRVVVRASATASAGRRRRSSEKMVGKCILECIVIAFGSVYDEDATAVCSEMGSI